MTVQMVTTIMKCTCGRGRGKRVIRQADRQQEPGGARLAGGQAGRQAGRHEGGGKQRAGGRHVGV